MRFNKHQRDIIKAINNKEVYDIESFVKKFNLYEYISEQDEINGLSHINMKLFEFISRLDINEVFNKWLQDEEIEYEK